jgi:Peptidase family M1 domain
MKVQQHYLILLLTILPLAAQVNAQPNRWQQAVDYTMVIDMDVKKHQYKGTQKLVYTNNSPDELKRVFYHLYFNAFQPGSMMDMRNITLGDSDPRVGSRIGNLKENEIGYQKIISLKQDGKEVAFEVAETILEVTLHTPIRPNSTVTFDMEYEAQVPVQIRRSGRDNAEGISYSMTQWYPKLCEYDYQGWHANPYVGREFHGVWGNFDVTINIDKNYLVGAGGYLQNPKEVGHGYESTGDKVNRPKGDKLSYHFKAPKVIDFAWTADPDYTHTTLKATDGPMMHFFYQKNKDTEEAWERLPAIMDKAFSYINKTYGKYHHDSYAFLQGGDGGMEYPMATLITGHRNLGSLVGVSVHELLHSWYQMQLASNESLYAWMDEGFTSYATDEVMNYLVKIGALGGKVEDNPQNGSYVGYANFALSGREEALSTHADHFTTNAAYGVGSYVKGAVFLHQLEYIIGEQAFDKGMLTYFDTWKFKHPNPNDFIRVMEKECDLELDWYKEYWINTTHTIDYGIKSIEGGKQRWDFSTNEAGSQVIEEEKVKKKRKERKSTTITLTKAGVMPMPIDVVITLNDGKKMLYHIPLDIMRGAKKQEFSNMDYEVLEDWPWTNPTYELSIDIADSKIKKIEIDPSGRLADVALGNNGYELK